ncbi:MULTISPECIES: transposase [Mycobacteriales]|uniref:Transposase n=1 Tax=Tsukamurella spumae TaxID=44753 RepID=A0A846X613_9ACTN|nr:transposase [Tsukamurella spumae]PZT86790.1 MAG: hypothetical protein DI630_34790 [Gordonia sp. (in: high G+C Gram-positive bacteria)]
MAPRSRRKFRPQFKAEAVQLVIQSERSIAEVAGELEIQPRHVGKLGAKTPPRQPGTRARPPSGRSWPAGGAGRAEPQVEDGKRVPKKPI